MQTLHAGACCTTQHAIFLLPWYCMVSCARTHSQCPCVHALQYLQYKNARPDYLKEVWRVVNWSEAGRRFAEATRAHVA